jgi:uncharacterized protein
MKHKKIVIAGGTGFIGQALARYFGKENHVILLSRQAVSNQNNNYDHELIKAADGYNITYWCWDATHVEKYWLQDIDGADIVINLAGKSVNCRYTEKNKQQIINSRTQSTKTIGDAIRQCVVPPKLWINASSATIYRHTTDKPNDEFTGVISNARKDNMPYSFFDRVRFKYKKCKASFFRSSPSSGELVPTRREGWGEALDKDFSVQVCQHWEKAFFEQRTPFTRKIALRAAVTLGKGGVMVPYYNLLKTGLGGSQGNGTQMYSWLHEEDLCRIIEWCHEHTNMEGVYNCSSPNAVTNAEFMRTLRRLTGHSIGLRAFNWMLEAGAALIGTETELILKSRWVTPSKLLQSGFSFKYNELEHALRDIVGNTPRSKYHLF